MINNELRLKVLDFLVANEKDLFISFETEKLGKLLGVSYRHIDVILEDFETKGYVEIHGMAGTWKNCFLLAPLYDYYNSLKEKDNTPPSKLIEHKMDIFISHSDSDKDKAKALIDLIVKAYHISSNKIRCTSVAGYKLPIGSNTDQILQDEIFSSKVFIGLITENSIKSTYVLFELGARWGAKLPLFPLISDPKGTSILAGPLKNINALNASRAEDVHQFITELGNAINVTPEPPQVYLRELEILLATANDNATSTVQKKTKPQTVVKDNSSEHDEYPNASDIIKQNSKIEWPEDYRMQAHYIQEQNNALSELRKGCTTDIDSEVFLQIRKGAKREWPNDYRMQLHYEREQIEAYKSLR